MKIQTGHGMITLTALLAIYSISMVTSLPGLAISPILGDLKNIFKNASDLELQMLDLSLSRSSYWQDDYL